MNEFAQILKKKIEEVIARRHFKPGYPNWHEWHDLGFPKQPGASKTTTWCNEAANAILVEMGYNTKSLLHRLGIGWTGATALYDNAAQAAQNPKNGIIQIDKKFAQELANMGHVIFVAAKNPDPKRSSHVGIVCPSNSPYSEEEGPHIGQAGAVNGIRSEKKSFPGLSRPLYYIIPRK